MGIFVSGKKALFKLQVLSENKTYSEHNEEMGTTFKEKTQTSFSYYKRFTVHVTLRFKNTTKIWICEIDRMFIYAYRNPKTLEIGSGTKLLFTFLSLRFFDMRRERHTIFFLCWLFHLTPPCAAPFVEPNWSRLGETKNRLPSSRLESQLTAFFQIPQILSASRHDVIHVPCHISYLGF